MVPAPRSKDTLRVYAYQRRGVLHGFPPSTEQYTKNTQKQTCVQRRVVTTNYEYTRPSARLTSRARARTKHYKNIVPSEKGATRRYAYKAQARRNYVTCLQTSANIDKAMVPAPGATYVTNISIPAQWGIPHGFPPLHQTLQAQ